MFPYFLFSSMCMLHHMRLCVCIICFRAYSCSLIFTLYPSSWVISFEVLKKPPIILSVTLLNFKSTFRNIFLDIAFKYTCSHSQKLCDLLVQYFYFTEKHNYGQQNNHAAENAVGSLAIAMRMQVSVTSNIVNLLLFL